MPVCLVSRRKVAEADAIAVKVGGQHIGHISPAVYEEMEEPEYKRLTFDVPDSYGED